MQLTLLSLAFAALRSGRQANAHAMTDDNRVEIARLQERVKSLESDLEKTIENLDVYHKIVMSLRQKLLLIGVGMLSFVASQAPELLVMVARITGFF